MAYTTINKHTDYFNTKIWTGNGADRTITTDHATDLIWIKDRGQTYSHRLTDSNRGVAKVLFSDGTSTEQVDQYGTVGSFTSTGFTLRQGATNSNYIGVNESSQTYVGWSWVAGGTASSNTDGSITSSVSANTTAGFSIVSYTGTGSNATVGHGLGVAPKIVIVKNRTGTQGWGMYNKNIGSANYLALNTTAASSSASTIWYSTDPTTTVFSIGTSGWTNDSGQNYIAYCFAEKTGYSKFGSYTGNNSTDGAFVYTGFKPKFVIVKPSNYTDNWHMIDDKRNPFNTMDSHLFPNLNTAETTTSAYNFDMLSNGFKPRSNNTAFNGSYNYIYMAFGQSLVGSNNVPCTAR